MKPHKHFSKTVIFLLPIWLIQMPASAAVPVVDLNAPPTSAIQPTTIENRTTYSNTIPQTTSPTNTQPLPTTEPTPASLPSREDLPPEVRIRLLEQQMNNLTQMNLPAKIDKLQQQIQQLNGAIEVQQHSIDQLTERNRNYSRDVDQRVSNIAASVNNSTSSRSNVANTAAAENVPQNTTTASTKVTKTTPAVTNNTATNSDINTSLANRIAQSESNVTQNIPMTKTQSTPTAPASDAETKAYQAAFTLLVNKQYDQSATAFQTFVKTYPHGVYAGNARYWLGEIYTYTNKSNKALQEFKKLIQQFPSNDKVPDALLGIAIIHEQQGKHDQAQQELQQLIQQYPNSGAAHLAQSHLTQNPTNAQ